MHQPPSKTMIIFDLETMGLCLDQLERSQPAADSLLLTRCLDRCHLSTSRIQLIVDKIQSVSVKRALLSRLYTALKDPDIAKLLGELEQAKSTLSLSLITYNSQKQSAMENTQLARMEQQSMQLQLIWTQTQANSIALEKIPHSSVACATAADSDGQLQMEPSQRTYGERAKSSKKTHGSHFSIRFPRWMCSNIWNVSLTHAKSGWNLKLRISTPRRATSEVFFRCMTGDIRAVQQMIAEGEASLSDCSADMVICEPHEYIKVDGQGLLWIAAYHRHVEPFQWLFRELGYRGINLNELALIRRHTPYTVPFETPSSDAILRTYLEKGEDNMNFDFAAHGNYTFLRDLHEHELEGVLDSTDLLQFTCSPQEAFEYVSRREDFISAGLFLKLLGLTTSSPQLANLISGESRFSALHFAASMLANAPLGEAVNSDKIQPWLAVVRIALANGMPPSLVTQRDESNKTAFLCLVYRLHHRCHPEASNVVRAWLETIQAAGVDLNEFGAQERSLWHLSGIPNAWGSAPQFFLECSNALDHWSITVSTSQKIPIYRLERMPGSFQFDRYTPEYICWTPEAGDGDRSLWQHIKDVIISGPHCDAFAMDENDDAYDGRATKELIIQDDTYLTALLTNRSSRSFTLRPRSASLATPRDTKFRRRQFPRPPWQSMVHYCTFTMAYESYQPDRHTIRSCANGTCYLHREAGTAQASTDWLYESFLTDIVYCLDGAVDVPGTGCFSALCPAPLRHTGKKDCPQGCGKIDLDRLHVPEDLLPHHPWQVTSERWNQK